MAVQHGLAKPKPSALAPQCTCSIGCLCKRLVPGLQQGMLLPTADAVACRCQRPSAEAVKCLQDASFRLDSSSEWQGILINLAGLVTFATLYLYDERNAVIRVEKRAQVRHKRWQALPRLQPTMVCSY